VRDPLDIEDPSALEGYLRGRGWLEAGVGARMTVLRGGVSNRTVLVETTDGRSCVVKQALARLRVSTEWLSDPARIHREALGLQWLQRLAPAGSIPSLFFEDPEEHVLAMEAVSQPHENWKTLLLQGQLEEDHVRQFASLLAGIHRGSQGPEFATTFGDRRFFESLRLDPYYRYTAERVPAVAGFLRGLIAETLGVRLCLVHGDYSPKNILVRGGRLVLLDHEVLHFGDPTFDLGFALTHFLSKANHLPGARARFLTAAGFFWEVYRAESAEWARTGEFERRALRQTLGCLLARVEGRSPLEYLGARERERQRAMVLRAIQAPPSTLIALAQWVGETLKQD